MDGYDLSDTQPVALTVARLELDHVVDELGLDEVRALARIARCLVSQKHDSAPDPVAVRIRAVHQEGRT